MADPCIIFDLREIHYAYHIRTRSVFALKRYEQAFAKSLTHTHTPTSPLPTHTVPRLAELHISLDLYSQADKFFSRGNPMREPDTVK